MLLLQEDALALEILCDEVEIVISKRKGIEKARRPELWIAAQQRLHRGPLPVPCEEPAHRHPRTFDHRASPLIDHDVRMGDANGRKHPRMISISSSGLSTA